MNTKQKTICIYRVLCSWTFRTAIVSTITVVQSILPVTLHAAQPDCYRLRTIGVPHQPKTLIVDLVVKPESAITEFYSIKDYADNTWYSLQNRTVQ